MAGLFGRVATQSCFALGPATTSLWWRSPACGSPCPRSARRIKGVALIRLPASGRCTFPGTRKAGGAKIGTVLAPRDRGSRDRHSACRRDFSNSVVCINIRSTDPNPLPLGQGRGDVLRWVGLFVLLQSPSHGESKA